MPDSISSSLNEPISFYRDVPPFVRGDVVLYAKEPWRGVWRVEGCKPHPRFAGKFTVYLTAGSCEAIDAAENYRLAPADWVDPPARPTYRLILTNQTGRNPEFEEDATRALYLRRYATWADRHLLPLGEQFAAHVARAQALAAKAEEEVAQ